MLVSTLEFGSVVVAVSCSGLRGARSARLVKLWYGTAARTCWLHVLGMGSFS